MVDSFVTKVTPFTRGYSLVGIKGDGNNYKYMKLQKIQLRLNSMKKPRLNGSKRAKKAIEKSSKRSRKAC